MNRFHKLMHVEQKRMKVAMMAMAINYVLFAYGIHKGIDLTDLGSGLAMTNAPILVWVLGETFRPTQKPITNDIT